MQTKNQQGFTLFELILVIVVIGMISAIAAPRLSDTSLFNEMGYSDGYHSALRYAQKVSMSSNCDTLVNIDSAGYSISQWSQCIPKAPLNHQSPTTVIRHPAHPQPLQRTPPTGVTINGNQRFYFDKDGVPHNPVDDSILSTALVTSLNNKQIIVEAKTGYIHVQ